MIFMPDRLTSDHEQAPMIVNDRRQNNRTRTVYRIARVRSQTDEGLARVRNISDGGMRLSIGFSVAAGDRLEVALSEALTFEGRVVWAENGECGLNFSNWVDSNLMLRRAAEEAAKGTARPLRLPFFQPAVVMSERGSHVTHLHDISQRGMKIEHDGSFKPGLAVKVIVGPNVERRGTVRWVRGTLAGLILIEPFSVEELGSASAL